MDLADFPLADEMSQSDWSSAFEAVGGDWRYVDPALAVSQITDRRLTPDRVAEVVHFDACTNDGGTELHLAAVLRLHGGEWATVIAWNDYTGWGCQDGVSWVIAPDHDTAIAFGLSDEQRRRFALPGSWTPEPPLDSEPVPTPDENEPILTITYCVGDVLALAEEAGVDPAVALERAGEWSKHIAATAMNMIGEQLASVVETNQP